jgi:hypothetical protein
MRATGRVAPEKVFDVIEFESSRAFGDVWALNYLWFELGAKPWLARNVAANSWRSWRNSAKSLKGTSNSRSF